jgi:hypothetical protein
MVMTKWGDRPHWEFDGTLLGSDEHGDWIGIPAGTVMTRPAMTFVSETDQVGLVPAADAGGGRGWLATFHAPGIWAHTYVDMTTPPAWDGSVVRAVDLDLDVVRPVEGEVFVDDEDEFAEHQRLFGYPPEIVDLAERSCAWVRDAIVRELPPFDGTAAEWLARVGSA